MIKIATAGNGIGSLIINTKATIKMIIAVFASIDKPSGDGMFNKQTPNPIWEIRIYRRHVRVIMRRARNRLLLM